MKPSNDKRTKKSPRPSRALYQALVENLPQSIFVKDAEGRFVFANQQFCLEAKRPLAEIIGKSDFDFHPPELAEKYRADDQRVMQRGEVFGTIEEHQVLGGEKTYVQVVKVPIYDSRGQVTGIQGIFWDVTERKRAENILRQSHDELEKMVAARTAELANERNLLRMLIDALPDRIYVKDAQSRFILTNVMTARHLGKECVDDVAGKTDSDFYPADLAAKFFADDQSVIQSGQPLIGISEQTVDAAGNRKWTLTTKVPFYGRDGKIAGLVGLGRDITESKRVEAELERERNLLRTLIDSMPDEIFVKDTESRMIVANVAQARLLGATTPEELVGKTDFHFFPQELAAQYYADEQALFCSGAPLLNKEEPAVDSAGNQIWQSTIKVPFRDSQGKIVGLVGICRDITERKQAEEMLRLQATRLQIAAEVARMVSSLLDIEQVLPRVAELIRERFGYYHVGTSLIDETGEWIILRASSSETVGHELEGVLKFRVGKEGMIGFVAGTGTPRVAQDVTADSMYLSRPLVPDTRAEAVLPLKIGDTVFGVLDVESKEVNDFPPDAVSILTTIADQIAIAIQNARLHSAEKQRAQELEQAYRTLQQNQAQLLISEKMASLGRLTAGIAHEMNTPLAAVRAALVEAEKLVNEYQTSIGDADVTPDDHRSIANEMQQALRLAGSAAERAASFVRGIKTQTRDLAAHESQRFNAVPVIRETLLLLGHTLRAGKCKADFEPAVEKVELDGSSGRLAQVITNLVTNAVDACAAKGGGSITLRLTARANEVELQVSDTGSGIPPEIMPKIFDPMFTTKPFGQGTGLGLAIVHDIVTGEFGGTIRVTSQIDQGTMFTMHFPKLKEG